MSNGPDFIDVSKAQKSGPRPGIRERMEAERARAEAERAKRAAEAKVYFKGAPAEKA